MSVTDWSPQPSGNAVADPNIKAARDGAAARDLSSSFRGLMAKAAALALDQGGALVTGGSGNAYTVSTNSGFVEMKPGVSISFTADRTNTAGATLSVDGAVPRRWLDADGTVFGAGDVKAGQIYSVVWIDAAPDGLPAWQTYGATPATVGKSAINAAQRTANLSDLGDRVAARGNLGLDAAATISDAVRAAIGNPVGNAISDRTRIGLCISPWDKGANGQGAADDTAALQSCVNQVLALQNIGFIGHAVIDLRGGTFAVSAPITMSGSPYDITFQNGSIRPFGSYSGILVDLDGVTAATRLRFLNLSFSGYGQCSKLLRMSKRTQGVWVAFCTFVGFTVCGFEDQTAAPATEVMLICNEFQGGTSSNIGTAIILSGNDGYVCDNTIRNVAVGIKNAKPGNAILRNHIYSISPVLPIPAVLSETGDQMQINDNYIDCAYLDIKAPSNCQIHNNKFFMTGSNVAGFAPIVLRPTSAGQALQCLSVLGNNFTSLFSTYKPVRIDTAAGTIGPCYQTIMDRNTFFGFTKMATEPRGRGTADAVGFANYNFFDNLPWGALKRIWGGSIISSSGYVTLHTISGSVGFITFSATVSGEWIMQGSVNDDLI